MYLSEAAEPLHFGVSNIQVMPGIKSFRAHTGTHTHTQAVTLVDLLQDETKSIDGLQKPSVALPIGSFPRSFQSYGGYHLW